MAASVWKADRKTLFYVFMGITAAVAAVAGFSTTYLLPVAGAQFDGPWIAHVHGLLFFAWVGLAVVQPLLVRRGGSRMHRRVGYAALPLALAMAASGVGVGIYAVSRDLDAGLGDFAYSSLPGVLFAMTIFLGLVAAAVVLRKKPDWHKRLMLLATIAVLWPAWFRFRHFMPWVPQPEILLAVVLADSLIAVAMLRDKLKFGQVHPAYWLFGVGLIAEHLAEAMLFDSLAWRSFAQAAYSVLT
jgi:uncharacterized membrane protein YozB (DUF420 family)